MLVTMKKFCLGICFGTLGFTILSALSDMVAVSTELFKAKIAVGINQCNREIGLDQKEEDKEGETVQAIGFSIDNKEEGYDFDDKRKRNK